MADSDEEPVAPRRPQPKPKPRSRMGARHSAMASPDGTPSSSSTNASSSLDATSPNRHSRIRVIEDDFFNKAKFHRPPKREVSKPELEEELEPLEQEVVLDAVSASKELPIFDFEDENETRQTAEKAETGMEPKRKRKLSLTPPPEEPAVYYKPAYDAPKPTIPPSKYDTIDLDDDDDDGVQELDPELASIAQKLSQRVMTRNASDDAMLSPTLRPSSSQSPFPSSSSQPGSGQSPSQPLPYSQDHSGSQETIPATTPAVDINIMIRKIRDPRLVVPPEMELIMREIEKPIKFIIKSDQPFRTSMELYCRQKHTQLAEVVFALRGNRLLPSSTPQTVDCPRVAVLDVYEADVFKFYKEQEKLHEAQRLAQMEMELAHQQEEMEKQKREEETRKKAEQASAKGEEEEEEEEDKVEEEEFLFIKLRGLDTQDEKLRVKKSTTVEAVLKHYRRLKKLDPDTPVHLSWDDEDLDPASTIGDTDVEDNDMLTVRVG